MKTKNISNIERRTFTGQVELRMEGEGEAQKESRTIVGYAAKFNQESQLMWDFVEVIEPGAFDDVLMDDVRALFNHDDNFILGRSNNGQGTLKLSIDNVGLRYEFEAPNTTVGNDLLVSIKRGDITQSSFAFIPKDGTEGAEFIKEVNADNSIKWVRKIKKIERLFDVSPVTYPAYTSTEVALRNFKEVREQNNTKKEQTIDPGYYRRKRQLQILRAKAY
jgi:HK97 family phage prohead protease